MGCAATADHLQVLDLRAMHAEVLWHVHDFLLGRHLGQKTMREKVLQRFYWSGIWEDCNNFITKCNECAIVKVPSQRQWTPLGEMLVGATLDRFATNILDPFLESTQGNKYRLKVTDYFTKWVGMFAIPGQSVVICAEIILEKLMGSMAVHTISIQMWARITRVLSLLSCASYWKYER